jgi:hypothetical protein
MAEIATIFQLVQLGMEVTSTPGTAVAATKKLASLMIEPQIKSEIQKYRGTGYKFPAIASMAKEWVEADLSGPITYTEIIYLLASIFGSTTPTAGTTDQTWLFNIDPDGADTPQTYTVEWGDATRALEFSYGLVNSLTLSFSREGCELSGTMLGSAVTDAITMTAGTTDVALIPVIPTQVSVYVADTVAGLSGASALTRVVSVEWEMSDRFNPAYFLDGSTDWAAAVETEPTVNVKLKMEKDAAGMALLANMRAGSTKFVRVEALGGIVVGVIPYTLQVDTACKVTGEPTFSDEDGIQCIEWDMEAFYDPTWGTATAATVINAQATL